MKSFLSVFIVLSALSISSVEAKTSAPLDNPILEDQARTLFTELRCVVCQGQSIADSHSDLAIDMQDLIRKKLAEGQKPADIKSYLHDRYGDFILLDPPFKGITFFVWALPVAFLGLLAFICYRIFRKSASSTAHQEQGE